MYFERQEPGGSLRDIDRTTTELRKLLAWLEESGTETPSAEYTPPIDVIERADAIEIVADMPGVSRDAIRILFTQNSVVVAGRKIPPGCAHREAAFHVAERTFGLFARAIRLTTAVDASRARASLRGGELHITLPRIDERRGRGIPIAIESV
ncbi:MAG TPA: Hsp20/alpha crystallin family protein [Vicinamibacterales bacterium]|nr:Hsp20/alpha crystallin family protein [Vicinamibacterales bacterium]